MIITVTLNAAIDKSLSVPNFRLGRRHRTVEQTTMPGGKGVNVARTLKTLGQPVIATGFAGGATGTRIVEHLTEESILNDFVRIREESRTNTAVHDPTNGEQTEINERGPGGDAQGGRAVPRQAALPGPRRRRRRLRRARCRAASSRRSTPRSSATCASSTSRPSSTPTASRCATRSAPSPTSSRRTSSRPRSSSATSSTTRRTASIAVREMVQLGPREAIMTLPDGCVACVLEDGAAGAAPRLDRGARGGRAGGQRRRLPGRLRRRALHRLLARRVPAPSAWPAAPSRPSASGRASIEPREVDRLLGEIEVERVDLPAEVP